MPHLPSISNELRLLILLSRGNLDRETLLEIHRYAYLTINWDSFINLAIRHKLLPLIHSNLKKHEFKFIPGHIVKRTHEIFLFNASRNVQLFKALCEITDAFSKHGIQVMSFKGLMLSQLAYGNICYRQVGDLDLLVRRQDVIKAIRLLATAGYQSALEINNRRFRKFISTENSIDLYDKQKKIQVELHWKTMDIYVNFPTDYSSYAENSATVRIQNRQLVQFGTEDLLFHLMLHATKHSWDHLELICCISEIISRREIDWDKLEIIISRNKCTRIFHLSMALVYDLYKTEIPESIRRGFKTDSHIQSLAETVYSKFLFPAGDSSDISISARYSLFHLRAKDRLIDRLLYCLKITTMPTIKEWLLISLPPHFGFLYYGIRPIRLMKELIQTFSEKIKLNFVRVK